jgi:hypothetical protein
MIIHFKSSGTTSRPATKERIAEIQRRLREQEAEDAKNPNKPKIIVRRA